LRLAKEHFFNLGRSVPPKFSSTTRRPSSWPNGFVCSVTRPPLRDPFLSSFFPPFFVPIFFVVSQSQKVFFIHSSIGCPETLVPLVFFLVFFFLAPVTLAPAQAFFSPPTFFISVVPVFVWRFLREPLSTFPLSSPLALASLFPVFFFSSLSYFFLGMILTVQGRAHVLSFFLNP